MLTNNTITSTTTTNTTTQTTVPSTPQTGSRNKIVENPLNSPTSIMFPFSPGADNTHSKSRRSKKKRSMNLKSAKNNPLDAFCEDVYTLETVAAEHNEEEAYYCYYYKEEEVTIGQDFEIPLNDEKQESRVRAKNRSQKELLMDDMSEFLFDLEMSMRQANYDDDDELCENTPCCEARLSINQLLLQISHY